jgi:hypothetical protein
MLSNNMFYNSTTRNTIVAFGSLFSNIRIKRDSPDNKTTQTISIPISYAPKEKWVVRLDQDPTLTEYTNTIVPRMSFEITDIQYDSARRVGKGGYITCNTGNESLTTVLAPVPYNMSIALYVLTKTTEDGLQIIEQILPYFTPEFTLSFHAIKDMNVILDVPVILNSVRVTDEYEGDFDKRRFVIWTLNFTLKTNFFGPVSTAGKITKVFVDLVGYEHLTLEGDPNTGEILFEQWSPNIENL